MVSRPLGISFVGSGCAGLIHARNFASAVPGAKLVALADPVAGAPAAAATALALPRSSRTIAGALRHPGVDAVVIVTPTALHREIAAEAGKLVFCEKPMAVDAAECDAMIEAAKRAEVVLQIGFMRRFSASFLEAEAQVEAGEWCVVQVRTLTHGPSFPRPWMFDLAVSNGPLDGIIRDQTRRENVPGNIRIHGPTGRNPSTCHSESGLPSSITA